MQVAWKEAKRRARLGVWDQYDSLGQIGQGTYGVVYKIVSKNRCGPCRTSPAQVGRPTNDRGRAVQGWRLPPSSEDKKEYAVKQFKATPDMDGLSQSACREINVRAGPSGCWSRAGAAHPCMPALGVRPPHSCSASCATKTLWASRT